MSRPSRSGALLALVVLAGGSAVAGVARDRFDHWEHRELFPTCVGCHAGAAEPRASFWPAAEDCTACHDGIVEERVEWTPPTAPRASNLRFTHGGHAEEVARASTPDSTLQCRACHSEPGGDAMQVRVAVVRNCLDCHRITTDHLEAPDSACAACHVPLVQAARLTRTEVSRFPAPPSHRAPGFVERGHGKQSRVGEAGVAASCATCHAMAGLRYEDPTRCS